MTKNEVKLTECELGLLTYIHNYCIDHNIFNVWSSLSEAEQENIIYIVLDKLIERGVGLVPILHLETCIDEEYLNMHRELSVKKGEELNRFFDETKIVEELLEINK